MIMMLDLYDSTVIDTATSKFLLKNYLLLILSSIDDFSIEKRRICYTVTRKTRDFIYFFRSIVLHCIYVDGFPDQFCSIELFHGREKPSILYE